MSGFLSIYPLDVTEILTVRQLDILRIDPVSNLKDAREIVLDLSTECEEVLFAFDKLKLEGFFEASRFRPFSWKPKPSLCLKHRPTPFGQSHTPQNMTCRFQTYPAAPESLS